MSSRFSLTPLFERGPGRFAPLDGLRALAVLWVVGLHCVFFIGFYVEPDVFRDWVQHPAVWLLEQGNFGVDLFFVISGYLITSLLLREFESKGTLGLRAFYIRRAYRILPAYWVSLVATAIALGPFANLHSVWANLLFINNFLPASRQAMGWTWSLAIEEQFYLVFPLVMLWLLRRTRHPVGWLCSVLAVAVIIRGALVWQGQFISMPFHPRLDGEQFYRFVDAIYDRTHARFGGLVCGVIVAWLERDVSVVARYEAHPRLATLGRVAGMSLLCLMAGFPLRLFEDGLPQWANMLYISQDHYLFAALTAFLLFDMLAAAQANRPNLAARCLSWWGWTPIAELSYGAFLLNPLVIMTMYNAWPPRAFTVAELAPRWAIAFGASFLFAYLLYIFVERPLRERGRRMARRVSDTEWKPNTVAPVASATEPVHSADVTVSAWKG